MPLHNFCRSLRDIGQPTCPRPMPCAQQLDHAGQQLITLRAAPPAQDYDGPVLFEAPAAGSLLAQMLGPSLGGARPPLSMNRAIRADDATARRAQRVDRPARPARFARGRCPWWTIRRRRQFQGQELIGSYSVDQEGVNAQKVALVGKRHAASIC